MRFEIVVPSFRFFPIKNWTMRAALLLLVSVPLVTDAQRPVPSEEPQAGPQQPLVSPPTQGGQQLPARGRAARPVELGDDVPSFQPEIGRRKEKYVAGQVLVRFRRDTPKGWMSIAHGVARAKVLQDFPPIEGLYLVQIPADMTVEDAIKGYRNQPEVLYAQPNYIYHALPTNPNDTSYADGTQWDMNNTGQNGGTPDADIDAPEAWDITTGSSSVEVVVIDTGIDFTHPDLQANVNQSLSRNCIGGTCVAGGLDDNNHGTHVSGTIGAVGNNNAGVVGVNWTVKLIACKFLDSSGSGSTGDAIACLNYVKSLKDSGAHPNLIATNNSWGGRGFDQALADAIQLQRQSGILFIAAAGNENADNDWILNSPANTFHPNVISVAATDRNDQLAGFSNYGKQTVHVGAPGVAIISTTCTPVSGACTHTFSTFNGTSMATPHVTGVAALLKAQDPSRDWKKIKNLIMSSGDPISALTNTTVTGRRLNARNAMTCSGQTVTAREQPALDVVYGQVGVPITLAALNINCADPGGNVQVSVSGGSPITLLDNGVNPDEEANDGVYSGSFTPGSTVNTTLTFPGGDVVTVFFPINPTVNYNAPTQPAFNYRNLTAAAKNLSFDDDTRAIIESPFPIAFGGGSFRLLNLSNNGDISFDTSFTGFVSCSGVDACNPALPTSTPPTVVAPWWDDLFSYGASAGPIGTIQNVRYEVQGSAPDRELILEWKDVEHFDCNIGERVTFQTVFLENSSNVLFQYLDTSFGTCGGLSRDNGISATVGVQVSPSLARQFSFNTASLNNNMALLFQLSANPVPVLQSFSPSSVLACGPDFPLTIEGAGFVNGASTARWNGSNRPTAFITPALLQVSIPASDLALAGAANITVSNAGPGGGISNTLSFPVSSPPAGVITSLFPDTIPAGTPNPFTLTVNGFGFLTGSKVRWKGADRTTQFISANQLTATIPTSDVTTAGTAKVTVFSCGPVSNAATFIVAIRNPLPTITSLNPPGSLQTGSSIALSVFGSNFVFNSTVRWNGGDRTTTFVNSGQLQAMLNAGDLTSPGTGMVTVSSPAPVAGTGISNTMNFPILSSGNLVPSINVNGLSPASAVAGSVRTTMNLQVNGSNFTNVSVVRWNGMNRTTMFNSSSQLTAVIPASDVAAAGTAQVTVFTPAPGGGTSNAQTFTINNPAAVISSLSPTNINHGGPQFTLTVVGSNFVPGAVVQWTAMSVTTNLATTYIGNSQLRATVPASLITSAGMASIKVVNPGAAASNSLNFTVN